MITNYDGSWYQPKLGDGINSQITCSIEARFSSFDHFPFSNFGVKTQLRSFKTVVSYPCSAARERPSRSAPTAACRDPVVRLAAPLPLRGTTEFDFFSPHNTHLNILYSHPQQRLLLDRTSLDVG
jgi:hypothetical protein